MLMKALVIDGYNAIHKIPYLLRIMDKSLAEARAEITKLAEEYKRKCGGIDKVYVVFDGSDIYRNETSEKPAHQVFSRSGKGDEKIVQLVSRLSLGYHVEVVSDDNRVRNNCRAHKATVLKVSDFMRVVRKGKGRCVTRRSGDVKLSADKAEIINEELRRHWNV